MGKMRGAAGWGLGPESVSPLGQERRERRAVSDARCSDGHFPHGRRLPSLSLVFCEDRQAVSTSSSFLSPPELAEGRQLKGPPDLSVAGHGRRSSGSPGQPLWSDLAGSTLHTGASFRGLPREVEAPGRRHCLSKVSVVA